MPGTTLACSRPQESTAAVPESPLPRLVDDLLADEVRHVEDVDGLLAERRDVRRGDIERQIRKSRGQVIEETRAIAARNFDDRQPLR